MLILYALLCGYGQAPYSVNFSPFSQDLRNYSNSLKHSNFHNLSLGTWKKKDDTCSWVQWRTNSLMDMHNKPQIHTNTLINTLIHTPTQSQTHTHTITFRKTFNTLKHTHKSKVTPTHTHSNASVSKAGHLFACLQRKHVVPYNVQY